MSTTTARPVAGTGTQVPAKGAAAPRRGDSSGTKRTAWLVAAVVVQVLVADSDNTLTLSISASSPLSLPWSLDTFLPQLASAADAVK